VARTRQTGHYACGVDSDDTRVTTTLRLHQDVADFVVMTTDSVCQERIVHMGWHRTGSATFSRFVAASDDIEQIHRRFETHLEEMILQSARVRPVRWEDALQAFLDRTRDTSLAWWLYGTGAMAVRGLDIMPGDLDFAVSDSELTADLLADFLVEPVTHHDSWVAEWTGRAFAGALIEWASQPRDHSEALEQSSHVAAQLDTIQWRGQDVAVVPLAIQLEVATQRGLDERVRLLRAALS
jgi:hypothetical protein